MRVSLFRLLVVCLVLSLFVGDAFAGPCGQSRERKGPVRAMVGAVRERAQERRDARAGGSTYSSRTVTVASSWASGCPSGCAAAGCPAAPQMSLPSACPGGRCPLPR